MRVGYVPPLPEKARLLGMGSYAIVRGFVDAHGHAIAVKRLPWRDAVAEIQLMQLAPHPHVATVLGAQMCRGSLCTIFLEWATNGDMMDLLHRTGALSERETSRYMAQVMSGLLFLHTHRIVHRDIKLENFVLTADMSLKIIDFSYCHRYTMDANGNVEFPAMRSVMGTHAYMSPEMLTGEYTGFETDLWSAGVSMFALLHSTMPFPYGCHSQEATRTFTALKHLQDIDALDTSQRVLCDNLDLTGTLCFAHGSCHHYHSCTSAPIETSAVVVCSAVCPGLHRPGWHAGGATEPQATGRNDIDTATKIIGSVTQAWRWDRGRHWQINIGLLHSHGAQL